MWLDHESVFSESILSDFPLCGGSGPSVGECRAVMWTSYFDVATQGESNMHWGHRMMDRFRSVVTFSNHDVLNWFGSGAVREAWFWLGVRQHAVHLMF